jgi:hypothetical protein
VRQINSGGLDHPSFGRDKFAPYFTSFKTNKPAIADVKAGEREETPTNDHE